MDRNYSALLDEYPEIISKEQVYRICHISKRKATLLLENGIIPCKDSGKKTHRFQVRTIDVVNYLIAQEDTPQKVTMPTRRFLSTCKKEKEEIHPIPRIPVGKLRKELWKAWAMYPDALSPRQISQMTGYSSHTVRQWITEKKLQSVYCPDRQKVAKQWLVEFISGYILDCPSEISSEMRSIVNKFIR